MTNDELDVLLYYSLLCYALLFCFVVFLMAVCDSQCVFSSQPSLIDVRKFGFMFRFPLAEYVCALSA